MFNYKVMEFNPSGLNILVSRHSYPKLVRNFEELSSQLQGVFLDSQVEPIIAREIVKKLKQIKTVPNQTGPNQQYIFINLVSFSKKVDPEKYLHAKSAVRQKILEKYIEII